MRRSNSSAGGKPTIGKVGFSLLSDRSSGDGGGLRLHRVAEFVASGHLLVTGGPFALWPGDLSVVVL